MKIGHHPVAGTGFSGFIDKVGHELIIPVHKIDFETFHSHLLIVTADIFHISGKCVIPGPQNNTDTFVGCIIHNLRKVDLRHHLHQICFFIDSPSFVENHIFDAFSGSKVNIVFIRFIIYSGFKIHSADVPGIPPVPRYLAGFYPRDILHPRRVRQFVHQIAGKYFRIFLRDAEHTPWKSLRTVNFSNKILPFRNQHLQHIMTALFFFLRI